MFVLVAQSRQEEEVLFSSELEALHEIANEIEAHTIETIQAQFTLRSRPYVQARQSHRILQPTPLLPT